MKGVSDPITRSETPGVGADGDHDAIDTPVPTPSMAIIAGSGQAQTSLPQVWRPPPVVTLEVQSNWCS